MLEKISASDCIESNQALIELENARKAHQRYLIKQQEEDWNCAVESYLNAAKRNPKLPEAYYRLAFLMWEKGEIDIDAAIEQCKTALEYSPDNANAHTYHGFFMNISKNFILAENEFKAAINLSGIKSARPRLLLSQSILKKINAQKTDVKDFTNFLHYFVTGSLMMMYDIPSLKVIYSSLSEDLHVFLYNMAGTFLENIKASSAALKLYSRASEKTGRKEIFYARIADLFLKNNNIERARDFYKKALLANSKNKDVLLKLATITCTYCTDLIDEAIDYYTDLLETKIENPGFVYYELGHLYLKKNDKINSISAFKLALENDKVNAFYHNSLAYAYLKAELFDDAVIHYNTAISINPDNEWTAIVCHALGSAYGEVYGDLNAAIAKFKEGLQYDSKNYELYLSLGDAYMASDDLDNAIRTYCDAITLNPDGYRGYSKAGLALWEKDFIEEAVISYHKAVELNPDFDIAQNNLGVIYLDGLGCPDEAIPYFKRAIEINPSYTLAYFNTARAAELLDNKTEAAQYYQMSLDLNKITNELDEEEIIEKLHLLFEL